MHGKNLLLYLAAIVLVAACAEQPSRETIGTGAGAVLGGVVGSEVGDGATGTLIGGVLGAVLGREVARRLDANDEQRAEQALEANRSASWQDPQTGERLTVNPTGTFTRDGRLCRRYTTTVRIEGQEEQATGTACKSESGQWELVS